MQSNLRENYLSCILRKSVWVDTPEKHKRNTPKDDWDQERMAARKAEEKIKYSVELWDWILSLKY